MSIISAARRLRAPRWIGRFTTDPAVRAGVLQSAWSIAPSYARGLLPRTPSQQAVVVGVNATTHYAIGATSWSAISTVAAGTPGHRAGWKALLTAATVTGVGGFATERLLRPRSGDNVLYAAAWSGAKLLATTGMAGGLVTASDLVAHRVIGRDPGLTTTLALDLSGGAMMAAGTMFRRNLRAQKYGWVDAGRHAVKPIGTAKSALVISGICAGTVAGIATLAVTEQTASRAINAALTRASGVDLGETGVWLSHSVTASGFLIAGGWALNKVRSRTKRENEVVEPAYPQPPSSSHVSCGPNSEVNFDAIGKEGRRFVLMTLTNEQITNVMGEPAIDPVRAVIPRDGAVEDRAQLAVAELERLGGFERSVIVVASPTGVGYVNYVMAEALEYLTRGNCAILVPQYALVPSALALDSTDAGTSLQAEVLEAISDRMQRIPAARRPRIYQFGESLGAQVALDVAAEGGIHRLDLLNVTAGLYLGVPFRSRAWHLWWNNHKAIDPEGRMVLASGADVAPDRPRMHLMVVHDDDPVNKFAYTMFFRRPWWFGAPATRPPKVPRETLFRPVSSFVIAVMDLLNGMNQKPGEFRSVGHDYRIDLRQALQKAYSLAATPVQAEAIEAALRSREQLWAERRLVATNAARAISSIQQTLNKWGKTSMSLDLLEEEGMDLPPAFTSLMKQLSDSQILGRLGSSGGN